MGIFGKSRKEGISSEQAQKEIYERRQAIAKKLADEDRFTTKQYFRMSLKLIRLTLVTFWRRHKIWSRLTLLLTILVLLLSIVYPAVKHHFHKEPLLSVELSPEVSSLLPEATEVNANRLVFDETTQTFEYNKDVSATSPSLGLKGGGQISVSFPRIASEGVTIGDPVSSTEIKIIPEFELNTAKRQDNRIIYDFPDVAARKVITVGSIGYKEDIIFESFIDDTVQFEYTLEYDDTIEARIEADGSIGVYGISSVLQGNISTSSDEDAELLKDARENAKKDKLLYTIPAPVVVEYGKNGSEVGSYFELNEKSLVLKVIGLSQAVYPLSIDPSVYVTSARDFMRGNNETNIDFDVNNELIQKGSTTGARFDQWDPTMTLTERRWGNGTAVAGGNIYAVGGTSGGANMPTVSNEQTTLQDGDSTSFTMDMPAVRPAGDLYIAVMCHDGTAAVNPPSGGGWTEYSDTREHAAYWKIGSNVSGGNEAASYTWTGPNEEWAGSIIRVTGFNPADPINTSAQNSNSGGSAAAVAPAVTPDENNTLILRAAGVDNDAPGTFWGPTGHTEVASGTSGSGTGDCGFGVASMDVPPAAGVSSGTATFNNFADSNGTSTIAINPLPGVAAAQNAVWWANFDTSTRAVTSPNPGTGACGGWCTDPDYNLPVPRTNLSVVAYNGFLYAIGGFDAAGVRSNDIYIAKIGATGEPQKWHPTDTNKNNWVYWYQSPTYDLPTERTFSGVTVYNNRMYVMGGQTNAGTTGVNTVHFANIAPNGVLSSWSTTGMQTLPSVRFGHTVEVYNDYVYLIGGRSGGSLQNTVYYSKLNQDGTMNPWVQTSSFNDARMTWGGKYTTIYGGYLYLMGGCDAINGSGYCTSVSDRVQLVSLNADGSLATWGEINDVFNEMIGHSLVAWRGAIYRIGGCLSQNTSTGECNSVLDSVDYGVINQDGDASTVSNSSAPGTGTCVGADPIDCDLPSLGDGAEQGGQMSSMLAINNGYIYNIGGCITPGSSCNSNMSGNVSYAVLNSNGQLSKPATCGGDYDTNSLWCVDSTNRINGTNGLGAAGVAVFNNTIYVAGGTDSSDWQSDIYRVSLNDDGSLSGNWQSQTFTSVGMASSQATGDDARGYMHMFTRANPASAGTNPGNLYFLGGCNATSGIGCSTYFTNTIKCNIAVAGTINGCTQSGQLQIDADNVSAGDQGLGLMAGTIYANRLYLVGGSCTAIGSAGNPCGSTYAANRKDTIYALIDGNNNIVPEPTGGGDWEFASAQMNPVRRRAVSFGYNGYIYSLAGYSGSASLQDLLYAKINVSTGDIGDWSSSGVVVTPRWDLRAIVNNGYVYAVGGCASGAAPASCSSMQSQIQTFQLYNNDSGGPVGYSSSANLFGNGTAGTMNRIGASSVIYNGYIYIAGGCISATDCTDATNDVQYAPLDQYGNIGTWSTTATLPADRAWGKLVEAGGTLYYLGGQSDTATDERAEVYYAVPSSGSISSWSTASGGIGDTPSIAAQQRTKFGAAVWNNRIYITGGLNGSATATNTVYVTPQLSSSSGGGNIPVNSWSALNSLAISRTGHTTLAYANNLYSLGGYNGSNYLNDVQFNQINTDGTIDTWTDTTSLPENIRDAEGFVANGYMYLVGGRQDDARCDSNTLVAPISANTTIASGNNPTGIGEWYETNQKYASDRYGAAVSYHQGKLYILGGACDTFPTINSLTTETFSAATAHNVDMPATVNAGDLLLALITNDGNATITSPGGGWTQQTTLNSGTAVRGSVWAKVANGTEGGTQVNFVTSASEEMAAQVYKVPAGNWSGSLAGVEASAVASGSVNNPNPPSLNPGAWGTENTLWLSYAAGSSYTSVNSYPTNHTSGVHTISNTGTAGASTSSAWRTVNAASEDPGAFSMSTTSDAVAITVAIRPAGFSYTGGNRVVQSAVYSQPQVAKYSFYIDADSDVNPNYWLMNGIDNSIGAQWQMIYRSSTQANNAWGLDTNFGDVTLGRVESYTPINGAGVDTNFARYYYLSVSIDSSQAFGYPDDVTRGPTINDLTLSYSADPNKRLRHGKTFIQGQEQPLDTPCRVTVEQPNCL